MMMTMEKVEMMMKKKVEMMMMMMEKVEMTKKKKAEMMMMEEEEEKKPTDYFISKQKGWTEQTSESTVNTVKKEKHPHVLRANSFRSQGQQCIKIFFYVSQNRRKCMGFSFRMLRGREPFVNSLQLSLSIRVCGIGQFLSLIFPLTHFHLVLLPPNYPDMVFI